MYREDFYHYCDATKIVLVYILLHKRIILSCLYYLQMDTLDIGANKQGNTSISIKTRQKCLVD